MSKALNIADEMAVYLRTLVALDGIEVIVDRQKDIEQKILNAVSASSGAEVVILYVGGRNPNPERMSSLRKTCKFSVTVETLPVIQTDEQAKSDELVEAIQAALHGWRSATQHCAEGMRVLGDELVPDNTLLRMDVQVEIDLTIK